MSGGSLSSPVLEGEPWFESYPFSSLGSVLSLFGWPRDGGKRPRSVVANAASVLIGYRLNNESMSVANFARPDNCDIRHRETVPKVHSHGIWKPFLFQNALQPQSGGDLERSHTRLAPLVVLLASGLLRLLWYVNKRGIFATIIATYGIGVIGIPGVCLIDPALNAYPTLFPLEWELEVLHRIVAET
ncbi:hypothetical protein BDZ94DRAFT_1297565 [Collybia nuda]|uniref:Uncharacterized protein n=1 Tax=Collybia nuda TaxID=64659 RepID=A0A9P5Y5I0_9AGAR|nr:hypothetical protein BDZ94DRAFT_1297565 [Collybia nuda]